MVAEQPRSVRVAQNVQDDNQRELSEYQGNSRCVRCHESPSMVDKQSGVTEFLRMNEAHIWSTKDMHSRAFLNVIDTDLGKAMLARLEIPVEDFVNAQQCTSCHSNQHWTEKHESLVKLSDEAIERESGVSCESCHGPSLRWDVAHSQPDWRTRNTQEKQQMGMVDLRSAVVKADTCYSCHIGNVDQGKVVTHEMYAAGHPPLPSVELTSFLNQMPPHWLGIKEKGEFHLKKEFLEANDLSEDSAASDNLTLNAAIASRTFLQLIQDVSKKPTEYPWPELALYDCSSCHHELKTPHWRNNAFAQLTPGRPYFQLWPNTLLSLEKSNVIDLTKVHQHLDEKPFGNSEVMISVLEKPLEQIDTIIDGLRDNSIGKSQPREIILQLCELSEQRVLDFHSARQVAWAIDAIFKDIASEYSRDINQAIQANLTALSEMMSLTFPEAPNRSVETFYTSTLIAISQYSPTEYSRIIKEIKMQLLSVDSDK